MTVGERLKHLRNKVGLSQEALSDQLGIKRATYAKYETDVNQADYDMLQTFAQFFDVSIDYILSGHTYLQDKNVDQRLLEIITDPEIQTAFNEIPGSPEEVKKEILDILRYIKFKKQNED
ncbi:transcriptional regulator with XRE-family HTH domain [Pullulanibacillus pueri]|uniref:Transcriptional regulator n=1 Tax=Pullulanibacillus pueri TaxID=1437324 RepID=A0A8J2ZZM6_9BACL|nr:helix-turn-helix transcriptional regulator [Pullulanibacillus pueri]MBM7683558.1 transcriptional regulator with XRE-family HTH domain [Pullulanibacillus pueri]GGH86821.1 transcriptional regulator [Pullulanibacillus pueri]